jgi:hypothetical protein
MRLVATLLLVAMALVFIATLVFQGRHPALPWVQAFAEAAVVGGLGSLFGGVLGAVFLRGSQWFITAPEWRLLSSALGVLVVSKVANFSIDLPEVSVAIQVSGQFGSRQEEAQRLGRILRPKADGGQAHFYSLVSDDTDEVAFARNRQRFLAEQGYAYAIVDAARLGG